MKKSLFPKLEENAVKKVKMDATAVKKVSATLCFNHKCRYCFEVLPEYVFVHVVSVCVYETCVSKSVNACVC